jgi:hypothetical protein
VTDLRQDMERQIDNWKEACRAGIGEFVHAELASQIDALSEGNWNASSRPSSATRSGQQQPSSRLASPPLRCR